MKTQIILFSLIVSSCMSIQQHSSYTNNVYGFYVERKCESTCVVIDLSLYLNAKSKTIFGFRYTNRNFNLKHNNIFILPDDTINITENKKLILCYEYADLTNIQETIYFYNNENKKIIMNIFMGVKYIGFIKNKQEENNYSVIKSQFCDGKQLIGFPHLGTITTAWLRDENGKLIINKSFYPHEITYIDISSLKKGNYILDIFGNTRLKSNISIL